MSTFLVLQTPVHLRAERLGDLHREGAYAARRAVDQDLLARLNPPFVAQRLQGGERRNRHGRRLLERPTASTCPAKSVPKTLRFGLRSPTAGRAM
jgi:hypothetical protein